MNHNYQVGISSSRNNLENRLVRSLNGQNRENASGVSRHSRRKDVEKNNSMNHIFAGELNMPENRIEQRRQEARKQAMKVIGNAFAQDKKIDDTVDETRQKILNLQKSNGEAEDKVKEFNNKTQELKDYYHVSDDSEEESDLKLLEKREDANDDPKVALTEDEQKRLDEIDQKGLTEYQAGALDNYRFAKPFKEKINDNNRQIEGYNQEITAIGISRLKSHVMVDAKNEADNIMEQANSDIKGMIANDAKKNIDDHIEEDKEKALKKKEKEQKEKKVKEAAKKKNAETEARIKEQIVKNQQNDTVQNDNKALEAESLAGDNNAETQNSEQNEATEQINNYMLEAQRTVEDMMQKMQLTQDDIKGVEVDTLR